MTWRTFGEYLDTVETGGCAINVAALVGHGALRAAVMGFDERPASARELAAMKRLLAASMAEGAFGLSSGLVYPPGCYSSTEELIELAKVVKAYDGLYATHVRGERETIVAAVEEAVRIGRESGLPVEVSHNAPKWGGPPAEQNLAVIEEARARGVDVTLDNDTHTDLAPRLSRALPQELHSLSVDDLVGRACRPRAARRAAPPRSPQTSGRGRATRAWSGTAASTVSSCCTPPTGPAGRHGRRHRRRPGPRPARHLPRPHRRGARPHRRDLRLHRRGPAPGRAAPSALHDLIGRPGAVVAASRRRHGLLALQLRRVHWAVDPLRARPPGPATRRGGAQDDLAAGAALWPVGQGRAAPGRHGRSRGLRPRAGARPGDQPVAALVPVREHPAALRRGHGLRVRRTARPWCGRAPIPA